MKGVGKQWLWQGAAALPRTSGRVHHAPALRDGCWQVGRGEGHMAEGKRRSAWLSWRLEQAARHGAGEGERTQAGLSEARGALFAWLRRAAHLGEHHGVHAVVCGHGLVGCEKGEDLPPFWESATFWSPWSRCSEIYLRRSSCLM